MDYSDWAPRDVRALISAGKLQGQTSGMCAGYAQANLCILPKAQAFDFLLFCMRNPRPCPILEVGEAGCRQMGAMARGDDVCTAFPKYRIWRAGELVEEVTDISAYWQDDLVYFLIGCSFSFESELLQAGVPVRHIEEGRNVPMFNTNLALEPAGVFHGNMVVPCVPFPMIWWCAACRSPLPCPACMAPLCRSATRQLSALPMCTARITATA